MITLLSILGILALLGIVATFAAMLNDGYRPTPTEWVRVHERGDEVVPDSPVVGRPPAPPDSASTHAPGGIEPRRRTARAGRRARLSAR